MEKISLKEFILRCGSIESAARSLDIKPRHLEAIIEGRLVPRPDELESFERHAIDYSPKSINNAP